MHRRRSLGSLLVLAGLVAIGTSCAEQRAPIDRTEAYALPKSLFTGEWYYTQTVVDVPGTLTVTMVGNTNYTGAYRVRWDVQENYLYARKAYELVEGAKNTDPDSGEYKGAIVGAWRITNHFDVKRGYNPSTGEESNVLEENAGDCKWYDCKYIRVDWSKNNATDFMFLDAEEDMQKEAVPFEPQDPQDPKWKPIFDPSSGYIDFVTAMAIRPGMHYFPEIQKSYPVCWLSHSENAECNTEIIKIRNSFMRRHPNRDFEPRRHEGDQSEWFGYFVTDKLTWESHYGVTQKTRQKLINKHNIWAKHHYEDQPCSTDKDCKEAGSRCDKLMGFHKNDVWTDTDADGLPDSFEAAMAQKAPETPLDAKTADSDQDGTVDAYDDGDKNGQPDLFDYYVWIGKSKETRCTIPTEKRDPVPVAYFNPGDFPRDILCDKEDKGTGACKPWQWLADKKQREDKWSATHHVSNDYDELFWKVFLRGGYNWSEEDYQKWINTKDPSKFSADQQAVLGKFGDSKEGYYAYTICPNNPVLDTDPWPCRFNRKSFAEAKKLMEAGKDKPEARPYIRAGDLRFSQVHYVKDYYAGMGLLGLGPSHTDPRTGENLAGVANIYALNDWAATNVQEMVQLLNGSISSKDYVDGVNLQNWIRRANSQATTESHQPTYNRTQLREIYGATVQPWMKRIKKLGSPEAMAEMKDSMGNPINNRQLKRMLIGEVAKAGYFDPTRSGLGLSVLKGTPVEKQMMNNEVLLASGFAPGSVSGLNEDVLNRASLARGGFITMLDAAARWRFDLANRRNAYFIEMADDALVGLAHRLKDQNPEQIWYKARDIIIRAVLTHELGHTFGLHHNWGGSQDALNFPEEYWRLRTNNYTETALCDSTNPQKDQLCPFFVKPMNDYQLGRSAQNAQQNVKAMYEYSYTSVMDYAGQYTLDGNGLGKYDKAAVMYGHADKVEVFKSMKGVQREDLFDEWFSTQGDILFLFNLGPSSYHYTAWFNQMGKDLFNESNRMLVHVDKVKDVKESNRSVGYFYTEGNKKYPRVPYIFCSFTKGDISDSCNTRDFGADQYERMKGHIDNWGTWYPMRAFTRYQFGSSPDGYVRRNHSRMYRKLKDFNNTYALYQTLFRQWYDDKQIGDFYTDPVFGYGAYTVAMQDAFNMALRTIAMPDLKGFEDKKTQVGGQDLYTEAVFSSKFSTDLVNARYFTTSWNDTNFGRSCGLYWWECLHHMGFYLDKIMALFTITDANTYFVARDTAEDIRLWKISFFDNYQTQLVDFFGSVLAHDYEKYAPWYDADKPKDKTQVARAFKDGRQVTTEWVNGLAFRNYATPAHDAPRPANGGPVEPATKFTVQLYMAVMGMLLFQENYDNDFTERSLMWKVGAGEGWDIKPNEKASGLTTFEDPFNGTTYAAIAYRDNRGIAQRMIKYANTLKSKSKYCDKGGTGPDACVAADPRAEQALYEYRQLMDVVLKVTQYVKVSSNWEWNPYHP
ncbi:MAG: hypothetical protein IT371_03340 [Deltaproteobacteria bacterium]|nr:hypothetical protein [Deltaproteobacteria bacterium]